MEKERLAIIETKLESIQKTLDEMQAWMKCRDEHSDKRYAPRWILAPLGVVGTAILVAIAGALIGLVLVPPVRAIAMIYIQLFS